MAVKVAINGFGRIGRQVTKAMFENYRGKFDLIAVNDLSDTATNAHLLNTTATTAPSQALLKSRTAIW
jgi:glyceraldehyde 3-phosphate dehydrogenase